MVPSISVTTARSVWNGVGVASIRSATSSSQGRPSPRRMTAVLAGSRKPAIPSNRVSA